MNFNKHVFTKEQFLDLPLCETKQQANVGEPFLLNAENWDGTRSRMAAQKETLLQIIERIQKANTDELSMLRGQQVKVLFWVKYKDGNVGERGGHITMDSIIDTIESQTLKPLKMEDLVPNVKDLKITVE